VVLDLDFLSSDEGTVVQEVETETREGELCLRFSVPSGNEFALAASGVREVMSVYMDRIAPIPNASPYLLGTYNWRGQVIWVGDLGQFLGDGVVINLNQSEVSILIVEEQETVMGFAVAEVANTEWLDIGAMAADNSAPPAMRPFVSSLRDDRHQSSLRLLDGAAILKSSRWSI
jgi:purine-binding chemotaxis protein CheW